MLKDRRAKIAAFSHPMAKVHAMDLFDIWHHLSRLYNYIESTMPALCQLARLIPGPGERIDPQKPLWMNGYQVSNLCQLLESLSWLLDEKIHI